MKKKKRLANFLNQDTAGREQQEQQKQVAETTAWLAANDKGDSIDVDEVTEPKDPLCKQYGNRTNPNAFSNAITFFPLPRPG